MVLVLAKKIHRKVNQEINQATRQLLVQINKYAVFNMFLSKEQRYSLAIQPSQSD
jgi:hypothetical protein